LSRTLSKTKPVIAIVGPTGTGKSHLAIELAQKFNGEIINADSRQVYRFLDIGTAKPSPGEFALVPHHVFDIINPSADFSLAQYQGLAYKAIHDIHGRQKLPLLVGGSGQYVWAVLEGWEIPRIPPDPELRSNLQKMAREYGIEELYRSLQEVDPAAASKIDRRNVRRVIRALEVSIQAKTPLSQLQVKNPPDFDALIIGLTAERAELYRRTDSRVEDMVRRGFIEEARKLVQMGYDFGLPSLNSIGYKQIGLILKGQISQEEAVKQIKIDNHRFVRHQYAWFRLKDKRIHWFDIGSEIEPEVMTMLADFLNIN
jgi:tRNA dimethylallyltransferase